MVTLLEFINENLINESLQNKYLQILTKTIKNADSEYYLNRNSSLKELCSIPIRWDKIPSDFGKEFKAGDTDILKLVRKIKNYDSHNILLIYNENKTEFKYIFATGTLRALSNQSVKNISTATQNFIRTLINEYDGVLLDFDSEEGKQYIIDSADSDSYITRLNNRKGEIIQGTRTKNYRNYNGGGIKKEKQDEIGLFNGDGYQLINIAEENKKRYESILIQKRKSQFDDNGLGDKIGKTVNDVLELVKNPTEKCKQDMYKVQGIMQLLYSQTSYDFKNRRSFGKNGLLPLYKIYIENKGHLDKKELNGIIDKYYFNQVKDAYNGILKIIDDINKSLQELK